MFCSQGVLTKLVVFPGCENLLSPSVCHLNISLFHLYRFPASHCHSKRLAESWYEGRRHDGNPDQCPTSGFWHLHMRSAQYCRQWLKDHQSNGIIIYTTLIISSLFLSFQLIIDIDFHVFITIFITFMLVYF